MRCRPGGGREVGRLCTGAPAGSEGRSIRGLHRSYKSLTPLYLNLRGLQSRRKGYLVAGDYALSRGTVFACLLWYHGYYGTHSQSSITRRELESAPP